MSFADNGGQSVRRREELPAQHPRERAGEGLLVGRALRPADALRTADQPAVPQQEQQARQADRQRRRLGRLYFGPKAPAGKEANWIADRPGKGWFAIFRLYGPLEPWFDKTWRPGEIEEVK